MCVCGYVCVSLSVCGYVCVSLQFLYTKSERDSVRERGKESDRDRDRKRVKRQMACMREIEIRSKREGERKRGCAQTPAHAQETKEKEEKLVPWLKSNGAVVARSARDCTHLVIPKIKTSANFLVLSVLVLRPVACLASLPTDTSRAARALCRALYVPGCACVHAYILKCICARMYTSIYAYVHTHTHTQTHTHTHTQTHTHVCVCVCVVCRSSGRRAHCDASVAQRLHQQTGVCAPCPELHAPQQRAQKDLTCPF